MPSPFAREPMIANGEQSDKEPAQDHAECEVQDAKTTVKDLTKKIEQSNSRAKSRLEYMEKLKKRYSKAEGDGEKNAGTHQTLQMMRELREVKQEMKKLREEMASLLEEKRRAEKEAEESNMKLTTLMSSVNQLKEEIEENNEEQVLVELARIEALGEFQAIESQRKQDAQTHSSVMDTTKKKMSDIRQEIEAAKEIEKQLVARTSDINMLESERKQVQEIEKEIPGIIATGQWERSQDAADTADLLKSVAKDIEEAKNELASVKEEGFKFMASMDIIRTEYKNICEEVGRAKKRESKTESTIQNLNSKLLRGKGKLEAATLAERKANDILSNLSRALDQLKTEAEAARKEKLLINDEAEKIIAEIENTDSEIELTEERLEAAIEELKAAKTSEAKALGKLKTLIENTVRQRGSDAQHSPVITISSFEHEYLKGRAAGAEEIADKKVAAAQAWIEAINASEREILMKTEMARKEMRELKIGEDQDQGTNQRRQSFHLKKNIEVEIEKWRQKYDEIMDPQLPHTPSNRSGRQAKLRIPGSPAPRSAPRPASFALGKRRKSMPSISKFFSGSNSSKSMESH